MRAFTSNVSLDAWLFGEEKQNDSAAASASSSSSSSSSASSPAAAPSASSGASSSSKNTNSKSNSVRKSSAPPPPQAAASVRNSSSTSSARSNSVPTNQFMNRIPRPKKTSFGMPGRPPTAPPLANGGMSSNSNGSTDRAQPELPSYPFPVSSKLRKLFQNRPNRLQWNRGRNALTFGAASDDKQQQTQQQAAPPPGLLAMSTASFARLQGHVPFSLKEIVKDPKKLPYLLQWLSTDDAMESATTKYHQVLLFLLELEQLQLVPDDKRRAQALKIWDKYIANSSEFEISSTLELTVELEQLVRERIDCGRTALDGFFPIQKLAYMRLTREEMPRFLKSSEYLEMLTATENDTESVPMERILQQPRAAHYFLLFLMQSRQHFELYFWLHVEYVLTPLLETDKLALFWQLARVLVHKAQHDSQAITRPTKNDLALALETRQLDAKQQPVARTLFAKAQQEIFVMLRSSWFDRFMKSNLYKVALQDSRIHLARDEPSEDSPPKLLSRTFSALEYASRLPRATTDDADADADETETDAETRSITSESKGEHEHESGHESESSSGGSGSSSGGSSSDESDESDFSKVELNLESIIRLTNLPDGLQVHYRPHYESSSGGLLDGSEDMDVAVDMVLTFATFVEKHKGREPEGALHVMAVPNPLPRTVREPADDDICNRVKAFLVPDGRTLIRPQHASERCPDATLFPFQQSGRNGFLFGSVYLTYESVAIGDDNDRVFVAKGFCVLSHLPLVRTLRRLVEAHVVTASSASEVLSHERLGALFHADAKAASPRAALSNTVAARPASSLARRYSNILNLPLSVLETRVDVSVRPLFAHFGAALVLQILGSALLECSVVLVSSQYTLLTECAEAIRVLLRPFAWCHVYAPVLPKPLLSYLQCPTPILVGVHSAFASRADLPTAGFYLVADMDRHTVEFIGEQRVAWRGLGLHDDRADQIFLPHAFETAKRELDRVLTPACLGYDRIGGVAAAAASDRDCGAPDADTTDERVRLVCLELFSGLLAGHTSACLVVGDTKESVVIFDETQFLSTRAPEDERFYQALMRAQCFSEIISAHSIDMKERDGDAAADPSTKRMAGAIDGDDDDDDDGVI